MKVVYRGKTRMFESVDRMMEKLGFEEIGDEDRATLERAGERGDTMFIDFNPLISGLAMGEEGPSRVVLLAATQDDLDETFYRLAEEV